MDADDSVASHNDSKDDEEVHTTLVEIVAGVAAVYGVAPEGLDLVELDLFPSIDGVPLSTVLGALGNTGAIAGNAAQALGSAQGLYRVNDATFALLQSGGKLATKDGAKLGAIFKNGKVVAQARLIPVSMTAVQTMAAIGPSLAMIALQMQLGEISGLVRTNIALTTQVLKTIRQEQWAELESLVKAIAKGFAEARKIGAVPETLWDSIASNNQLLHKQMSFYQSKVADHALEVGNRDGSKQREFLKFNAEAIVFDTYALLNSLKSYAEYQTIRALRAKTRSNDDEHEARLFDQIVEDTPIEIQGELDKIAILTKDLVRELRIIAELPGRRTAPLTKKRRDTKAAKLTCEQLLKAIEPVADFMSPPVAEVEVPEVLLAPEGFDLDPYLRILRWRMDRNESLQAIAFARQDRGELTRQFAAATPSEEGGKLKAQIRKALTVQVDNPWDTLPLGNTGQWLGIANPSTFIAVTDCRIITASPRKFLRLGESEAQFSLGEILGIRRRQNHSDNPRSTISIVTAEEEIYWLFPEAANDEQIDLLTNLIVEGSHDGRNIRASIDDSQEGTAEQNSIPPE